MVIIFRKPKNLSFPKIEDPTNQLCPAKKILLFFLINLISKNLNFLIHH